MIIPVCPWRPARCLVTDFITPNNVAVKEQSDKIKKLCKTDDDYIAACAKFVGDEFEYPLDYMGNPSAGMSFKMYDKGRWWKYFFSKTMDYTWKYPNEVLVSKLGICEGTANLYTSLLLAGGVPAKTALGAVVNVKDDSVAGYHAWTEMVYKGNRSTNETTIHPYADTIKKAASTYNSESDWATSNGIYYRLESLMNDTGYEAEGDLGKEMVSLMGMSAQKYDRLYLECFGIGDVLDKIKNKRRLIAKEWAKSENIKQHILKLAYGGG